MERVITRYVIGESWSSNFEATSMFCSILAGNFIIFISFNYHFVQNLTQGSSPFTKSSINSSPFHNSSLIIHIGKIAFKCDFQPRFHSKTSTHGFKCTSAIINFQWVIPKDTHVGSITSTSKTSLNRIMKSIYPLFCNFIKQWCFCIL